MVIPVRALKRRRKLFGASGDAEVRPSPTRVSLPSRDDAAGGRIPHSAALQKPPGARPRFLPFAPHRGIAMIGPCRRFPSIQTILPKSAILIDEYDDPVAKALKNPDVPCCRTLAVAAFHAGTASVRNATEITLNQTVPFRLNTCEGHTSLPHGHRRGNQARPRKGRKTA